MAGVPAVLRGGVMGDDWVNEANSKTYYNMAERLRTVDALVLTLWNLLGVDRAPALPVAQQAQLVRILDGRSARG